MNEKHLFSIYNQYYFLMVLKKEKGGRGPPTVLNFDICISKPMFALFGVFAGVVRGRRREGGKSTPAAVCVCVLVCASSPATRTCDVLQACLLAGECPAMYPSQQHTQPSRRPYLATTHADAPHMGPFLTPYRPSHASGGPNNQQVPVSPNIHARPTPWRGRSRKLIVCPFSRRVRVRRRPTNLCHHYGLHCCRQPTTHTKPRSVQPTAPRTLHPRARPSGFHFPNTYPHQRTCACPRSVSSPLNHMPTMHHLPLMGLGGATCAHHPPPPHPQHAHRDTEWLSRLHKRPLDQR